MGLGESTWNMLPITELIVSLGLLSLQGGTENLIVWFWGSCLSWLPTGWSLTAISLGSFLVLGKLGGFE